VLIISGKPDELAVGIEHNTRKHVQILKRIGISRLIVAVNKMDAVDYAEEAFATACDKVAALLGSCGFHPKNDVVAYLPISGLAGANLIEVPDAKAFPDFASWYNNNNNNNNKGNSNTSNSTRQSLLDAIDQLDPVGRMHKFPLRFVVHDVNPKGTLSGRVATGTVSVGDALVFLPANAKVTVRSIEHSVSGSVKQANAGDTVDISSSSDVSAVCVGNIGCPAKATKDAPHVLVGNCFEAAIQTYGAHARPILPGHSFVMMINGVQVQAKVRKLLQKMDMATGVWGPRGGIIKMIPRDVEGRVLIEVADYPIPFERSADCMALGKFLMKQELNIVGGGIIEELAEAPASTSNSSASAQSGAVAA
jgi:translation elongation factor EF-1alpha